MRWKWAWGLAALFFLLTGCIHRVDPTATQEWGETVSPPIYGPHTVGQSFVATQPRLAAIDLFWARIPAAIPVVLRLHADGPSGPEIAAFQFTLSPSPRGYQQRIAFPPLPTSQNRRFYVELQAGSGSSASALALQATDRDRYGAGQLYRDRMPHEGDLKFRAVYDYDLAMVLRDLWREVFAKGWMAVPLLALLWAPGYLLWVSFAGQETYTGDFWERLALAVGIGLAVFPLLLLWITQLGGALGVGLARALFGLLGLAAIGMAVRRWRLGGRANLRQRSIWLFSGIMALVLLVGLAVRLLAVRDLVAPAWVDSVHHTVVARIIAETGRVPATYEPYVPVQDATYHFGFQAHVAAFHWLTGLPLTEAMLVIGQVFNALMALQVYLFARWLKLSRRAALLAGLIVALVSTMPAYYVSWGRYTQLTGLLILPAAVVLTARAATHGRLRLWGLALLTLGGLTLTHYRVLAFYVCLMGAHWLVGAFPNHWRRSLRESARTALLFILSLLILMPWIWNVAENLWGRALRHWGGGGGANWDFSLYYVTAGFDQYILGIAALGVVVGLWQRRRFPLVILAWLGALFIVTNPSLLNLPGEGLTNNTAMLIAWFMPLAALCAYLLDEFIASWLDVLKGRWRVIGQLIFGALLVGLALSGLARQIAIVNPTTVLFHPPDQEAMAWIEENTPSDAVFLINATGWLPALHAGSDGGFWISPLTQRRTTAPPVLSGLGDPEVVQRTWDLAQRVEAQADDPQAVRRLMQEAGADYVYVGARGGPLSAGGFWESEGFELVFSNDRVFIFRLSGSPFIE